MKPPTHALMSAVLACALFTSTHAAEESSSQKAVAPATQLTERVREELLAARETAWRSFFQKDASVVEKILAPELIAIQQNEEKWDNRAHLVALAKSMSGRGVELRRLEFPHTEIQLFGDTAILYYTYIMEQALGKNVAVDAGRGTEVFVRRDGRWVDVGWHLDSGPFSRVKGEWVRVGEPVPAP